MKIDEKQIFRWLVLNNKLEKSDQHGGFLRIFYLDDDPGDYDSKLQKYTNEFGEPCYSKIENVAKEDYADLIKSGEIEIPKSDSCLESVYCSDNPDDCYEAFGFKPNKKLIKKHYDNALKNWQENINTEVNQKNYEKQKEFVINLIKKHVDRLGEKGSYEIDSKDFRKDTNYLMSILSLEKDGVIKIEILSKNKARICSVNLIKTNRTKIIEDSQHSNVKKENSDSEFKVIKYPKRELTGYFDKKTGKIINIEIKGKYLKTGKNKLRREDIDFLGKLIKDGRGSVVNKGFLKEAMGKPDLDSNDDVLYRSKYRLGKQGIHFVKCKRACGGYYLD